MAGSNSNYSVLVDVQLQEESIKKQLKDIQNSKDTKLKIGVTADGAERGCSDCFRSVCLPLPQ